jgi:hypothetical protein
MAEIEIAILERNALSRRLEDEAALRAPAWWRWKPSATNNGEALPGSSRGRDARIKLERLYPIKADAAGEGTSGDLL